jgi:hypothetical protein
MNKIANNYKNYNSESEPNILANLVPQQLSQMNRNLSLDALIALKNVNYKICHCT